MTYKGTVKNGVVVLPSDARLADGVEVEVQPAETEPGDPLFLRELLKLSQDRDWPADFALNHAHYSKGHPKKS